MPTFVNEVVPDSIVEVYEVLSGVASKGFAGQVGIRGGAISHYQFVEGDAATGEWYKTRDEVLKAMEAHGVVIGKMLAEKPVTIGYSQRHEHGSFVPE